MTFVGKVGRAIHLLKKHYNEKYILHRTDLVYLRQTIIPIRNHMAHAQIYFDENKIDRNRLTVMEVAYEKTLNDNGFNEIEYKISDIEDVADKLRKMNIKIRALAHDLLSDYQLNLNNPNFSIS